MGDKAEWVSLGPLVHYEGVNYLVNYETLKAHTAVDAALRCRRVVQVRFREGGGMEFCARIPLPKKVQEALARTRKAGA
jgi:hypothetical protein